jgi:hypothetical protein
VARGAARVVAALLAGAAGAAAVPGAQAPAQAQMQAPSAPIELVANRDPWAPARPRWWDISNSPFNGFLSEGQEFRYDNAYSLSPTTGLPVWDTRVTLTYDTAPNVAYFVGRIEARGLKPNFAYQVKLLGKPQKGARGWGALGDDVGNERIGYAGRWWCDSSHATQTNFDDSHYVNYYKNAPLGQEHAIYGYLFTGIFVTDRFGNASIDISGRNSYHITWQSWQNGRKDVLAGTWPLSAWVRDSTSTSPYYAYGATAPAPKTVSLYYEYETGRAQPVALAAGTYHCRMVLTEESFHNTTTNGGYWQSVLTTEDRDLAGQVDTEVSNDITFTLSTPAVPTTPGGLSASTVSSTRIDLRWADNSANETSFEIERSRSGGAFARIATLGANATSYADTSLVRNTSYAFRVRAVNATGASAYSNTSTARTAR